MMSKEFIDKITREVMDYVNENNLNASNFMRNVFDGLSDKLKEQSKGEEKLIESENAVVEIIDKNTGMLYRRYLELRFHENSNGIIIEGENLSGEKSQIVFLSNSAIVKIKELHGEGPDEPRCK